MVFSLVYLASSFLQLLPILQSPFSSLPFHLQLGACSTTEKGGGCSSEDHTVVLLRRGPYAIIRHPSHFAWSVFFVTIPIFLSRYVTFTFLSIVGILGIVIFHYYVSIKEERDLDMKKWGDEYRQYMEEVPRWNILMGLVKLAKRK